MGLATDDEEEVLQRRISPRWHSGDQKGRQKRTPRRGNAEAALLASKAELELQTLLEAQRGIADYERLLADLHAVEIGEQAKIDGEAQRHKVRSFRQFGERENKQWWVCCT